MNQCKFCDVVSPGSIFDIVVDIPKADIYKWPGEILHASFLMTRIVLLMVQAWL